MALAKKNVLVRDTVIPRSHVAGQYFMKKQVLQSVKSTVPTSIKGNTGVFVQPNKVDLCDFINCADGPVHAGFVEGLHNTDTQITGSRNC